MKIRTKSTILVVLCVVLLITVYLGIKYFFKEKSSPYPSLAKQRSALKHKPAATSVRLLDSAQIINDLRFLASDTCEGRRPGSDGHERAAERIVTRMREAGLDSFDNSLILPFQTLIKGKMIAAKNIIGWIKGTQHPEKYIVISAHYDHMGKIGDSTYYGASDNASGTACILAMARYFKQHPQPYSYIFAAFDAEETGLKGARYFTRHLPHPLQLSSIKFNLNIDMIVRNDNNEIFACGIYHYPSLKSVIRKIQPRTNTKILMGHDQGPGREDWTTLSDHYAFHVQGIPFLYFGTEDHIDYHRPTDTWNKIDLNNYIENCNMLTLLAMMIDPDKFSDK